MEFLGGEVGLEKHKNQKKMYPQGPNKIKQSDIENGNTRTSFCETFNIFTP